MKTLKEARIEKQWSQGDLSEICGLTSVTISNLERGVTRPQKRTRKKLESILGPIDWNQTENEGLINSEGAFAQSRNGTSDAYQTLN